MKTENGSLQAGAAVASITPTEPVFLFGYPNVPRWSTGVHDPLLATALYLGDGKTGAIFIGLDVIFVSASLTRQARRRIEQATSVPGSNILISATHTHSGPITVDCLSNEHDKVVPRADHAYLRLLEDRIVEAASRAVAAAEAAEAGLAVASANGVGTNRRDPAGPTDLDVPVLLVRRRRDSANLAVMLVCSMHPTVLHEDSTLISGDFPGLCRRYLQQQVVGGDCCVLYHTGPAGNLSPRHVVCANTITEAQRLGELLGSQVARVLSSMRFDDSLEIRCAQRFLELPLRTFSTPGEARAKLTASTQRLEELRAQGAPKALVRTAECDWFGAQETLTLARAASEGRIDAIARTCMPAEVQLIRVGPWAFVGWPGEMFVEFSLAVKQRFGNTFPIAYANGELQGYLVTRNAADEGGYEASNAIFKSPESGQLLVDATLALLNAH